MNQSFAIDLLSVDKNIKLLTKKSNFYFISQVFNKISTLRSRNTTSYFLRVSNEYFYQLEIKKDSHVLSQFTKLQKFVTKVIDLSISHKKKHNLKDIQQVISIGQTFKIEESKIINWIAKITVYSKNTDLLDYNTKNHLLQKKDLRERYISLIINSSQDIKLLEHLFNLYESHIYDIYSQYKGKETIWTCLLPIHTWKNFHTLPLIDKNKLNWLENKNIGYRNNPVYFELYQLENEFRNSVNHSIENFEKKVSETYYQNIIYNSLNDYHKIFCPKKEAAFNQYTSSFDNYKQFIHSDEYNEFKNWITLSHTHSILSIYDNNKDFYDYCKKLKFKLSLEDTLIPENKKIKKMKI